jgi:hypothetical protein
MAGLRESNDFRRALQEACEKEGVTYNQDVHRRVHDELHSKSGAYDESSNDLSYSELVERLRQLL